VVFRLKEKVVRSYTFDVLVRESASGYSRITEGAHWYRLASKMARKGTATLVLNSKVFAGYGSSPYVGFNRLNYTVNEKVN
jgi:hypothetical protein